LLSAKYGDANKNAESFPHPFAPENRDAVSVAGK
jgi:hypothetical protein